MSEYYHAARMSALEQHLERFAEAVARRQHYLDRLEGHQSMQAPLSTRDEAAARRGAARAMKDLEAARAALTAARAA